MTMQTFLASRLASLVNQFTIDTHLPRTIQVPHASTLAGLQEITMEGVLLKKQFVRLDKQTNHRAVVYPKQGGGQYVRQSDDGDLHFCLGTRNGKSHVVCELQNAKAWLPLFNQSIGKKIVVSGFFRCMFEHPGFSTNDDAHIFEIHPVRAVTLDGQLQSFDVGIPDQKSIHAWDDPEFDKPPLTPLNKLDSQITAQYDKTKDNLTFRGMDLRDHNYVRVSGSISQVKLHPSQGQPATFTFTSPQITRPLRVYCLKGTNAAISLQALKSPKIAMVALRNIDLPQALNGQYVINLLAIDIQPAP